MTPGRSSRDGPGTGRGRAGGAACAATSGAPWSWMACSAARENWPGRWEYSRN